MSTELGLYSRKSKTQEEFGALATVGQARKMTQHNLTEFLCVGVLIPEINKSFSQFVDLMKHVYSITSINVKFNGV